MSDSSHVPTPYIGFHSSDELTSVGGAIAAILQGEDFEIRDGMNIGGGEYVRFVLGGSEVFVIDNRNEDVHDEDLAEFEFYIWGWNADRSEHSINRWNQVASEVETALIKAGIIYRISYG